jgi:hypothetical protein
MREGEPLEAGGRVRQGAQQRMPQGAQGDLLWAQHARADEHGCISFC